MSGKDRHVNIMLAKHGIQNYRALLNQDQYSKDTMSKGIDDIIKPFSLTMHEKNLSSDLGKIALSQFHSHIASLDEHYVHSLNLETIKKSVCDEIHRDHSSTISQKQTVNVINKGADRRRRRNRSTSHFEEFANDKKRARGIERSIRPDSSNHAIRSNSMELKSSVDESLGDNRKSLSLDVLQSRLEEIFKEFWELELDHTLATPFFGLIERHTCDAMKLPRFFDKVMESCTLANISVKLKSRLYSTLESFESDFNLMFNNIFLYFPDTAPQYVKARELQTLFRDRWTNLLLDLKKI